jgi:hypothetical protein
MGSQFGLKETVFALFVATAAYGQVRAGETAVLPAARDTAGIVLAAPANIANVNTAKAGLLLDEHNKPLSPQPQIALMPLPDGSIQVTLSKVFFWGEATLPIRFAPVGNTPASTITYKLERGVTLSSRRADSQTVASGVGAVEVDVPRYRQGELWIHNPDTSPVKMKWRIVSGAEDLCGLNNQGELRADCGNVSNLPEIRIAATGTVPVRFPIPAWWRNPLDAFGGIETRGAQIQLFFGQDEPAQRFTADLTLAVHSNLLDAATAWVPELVRKIVWVFFWITIGVILLMLAQVSIPNFRRSLQMEAGIDELRERLRAINSGVGNRLYTRCQQEIGRVTEGLGIAEPNERSFRLPKIGNFRLPVPGVKNWLSLLNRLALSGNSQEILRLEALLPRIESRLSLTERLSDVLTAFLDTDTLASAPSSVFDREDQLRTLREILSRQLLTDAEEAGARAILDRLEQGCAPGADFEIDLNSRLDALRRQLQPDVFKTRAAKYISKINGCAEVLAETAASVPSGGWSVDELVYRDLMAVKLRIIVLAVEIEALLAKKPDVDAWIQERLQTTDPVVLGKMIAGLREVSEGVSQSDIRDALKSELWDTLAEPPSVRSQDVLQFSFWFRDKSLNRSCARETFQCYWKVVQDDTGAESWEEGWTMQYIPAGRRFTVEPAIYDSAGNQVAIRKTPDSDKGIAPIQVARTTGIKKRLFRGAIDAAITALVPVATVAVTEVQNGGALSAYKLILLGFTSQAIRAAVIPESVRPEAAQKTTVTDAKPAKPAATAAPAPALAAAAAAGGAKR